MVNSSKQHTLTVVPNTSPTSSTANSNISENIKAEVTMALSTLDRLYKENIGSYAKVIHECTHKIEKLQSQLELLIKEQEPHTNTLHTIKKDINYELRLLERLTEEWNQKLIVINELESELSQLEHSSQERQQILKGRHKILKKLAFEIEDIELSLLEHELQKQNLLLLMEPIEREIKTLMQSIKDLESEKRYIESSHLHHLSPSIHSSAQLLIDKTDIKN